MIRHGHVRGVLPVLVIMLGLACSAGAVRAQQLDETLERVAGALHRGDADAIARLSARAGLSLDVDGNSVGPLGPPRQCLHDDAIVDGAEDQRFTETLDVVSAFLAGPGE